MQRKWQTFGRILPKKLEVIEKIAAENFGCSFYKDVYKHTFCINEEFLVDLASGSVYVVHDDLVNSLSFKSVVFNKNFLQIYTGSAINRSVDELFSNLIAIYRGKELLLFNTTILANLKTS